MGAAGEGGGRGECNPGNGRKESNQNEMQWKIKCEATYVHICL